MKKALLITAALATLSTSAVSAEKKQADFSGSRFGIGFSNSVEGINGSIYDAGQGLHLEYGYDFNKIVGLNLSYDTTDLQAYIGDIDSKTFKIGADIGYAFIFSSWALKPYASIGYSSVTANLKSQSYYFRD